MLFLVELKLITLLCVVTGCRSLLQLPNNFLLILLFEHGRDYELDGTCAVVVLFSFIVLHTRKLYSKIYGHYHTAEWITSIWTSIINLWCWIRCAGLVMERVLMIFFIGDSVDMRWKFGGSFLFKAKLRHRGGICINN